MSEYSVTKNNKELKGWDGGKYYGQWETDKIIESYFEEGFKGNCIEIGAANGIKGSNTLYFEERGWDALCIEPNIEHTKSLEEHRKLVRYFACGDTSGTFPLTVYRVGEKNIMSSLTSLNPDERLVEAHKDIINEKFVVDVKVEPLGWILNNTVEGTPFDKRMNIDFISIDTEGTELDVLKGINFSKYEIKLLVVENNYNDDNIEEFMISKGYKKDQRYKINDFYIKQDKQINMKEKELFSLGDIYVSDFMSEGESPRGPKSPLTLVLEEETGAARLTEVPDCDVMYGKYWYRSGINATMTRELKAIVDSCLDCVKVEDNDVWLDIACNDGTLLKAVPDNMVKVGVDPADDSFTIESRGIADLVIQDYFTKDTYKASTVGDTKPKIVTTIAMFYDLDDPISFLQDVYDVMDDEGLFVLQMSYTPLMLKQLAFDNICHEHVYYYTLKSIKQLLDKVGFNVVDCQLNDVNGGSFRVYIRKDIADETNFKTSPYRDVASYRVESILAMEEKDGMDTEEPYMEFWKNINQLKEETVAFIKQVKSEGKTVWGYGASTKGNTLLQWFGLDDTLIDGIAERSPYKFGLKTVGTNIPIYSEKEMRKVNPDYMLVLPWHFINEFVERESDYLKGGGKFIVPCPKFEIIGEK